MLCPMHCTTMFIISNAIPMYCITKFIITMQSQSIEQLAIIYAFDKYACISNRIPMHCLFSSIFIAQLCISYHKQLNSNALHNKAYLEKFNSAQLCLS